MTNQFALRRWLAILLLAVPAGVADAQEKKEGPATKEPAPVQNRTFYLSSNLPKVDAPLAVQGGTQSGRIVRGGKVKQQGGSGFYVVEDGGELAMDGGSAVIIAKKGAKVFLDSSATVHYEQGAEIAFAAPFPIDRHVYVNITLEPFQAYTLRGQFRDADGKPRGGITVHAFGLGKAYLGKTTTGADGSFKLMPPQETNYLVADVGANWATERGPANPQDLDRRLHVRSLQGWEVVVREGSWAKDATVDLQSPGQGSLYVKLLHHFSGQDKAHSGTVRTLAFSPDRQWLVSVCDFGKVCIWDLQAGKLVRAADEQVDRRRAGNGPAYAFSPDSKALAMSSDKALRVVKVASGEKLHEFPAPDSVSALTFSPDGKTLARGGDNGEVVLWDLATGKESGRFKAHAGAVHSLTFDPAGQRLLTAGDTIVMEPMFIIHQADVLRVWDLATGKELGKVAGCVKTALFSPDGKKVASAGLIVTTLREQNVIRQFADTQVQVSSAVTGAEFFHCRAAGDVIALAADGRTVMSAGTSHIQVWEMATGAPALQIPISQFFSSSYALSRRGELLATTEVGGDIRVWDVGWERVFVGLAARKLASADWPKMWDDLKGDAGAAYPALITLRAHPQDTVAWLQKQLQPSPVRKIDFAKLLADLESEQFVVRDAANRALLQAGAVAEPTLRDALKAKRSLESRRRLETILAGLETQAIPADELRQVRAVALLEQIGNPAARQLLQALAGGWPAARQTQEASASLQRLGR